MPARPEIDLGTLLCERCGYVLEGLPAENDCPECGTPIAESLPEHRIGTPWQRDPGWGSYVQTARSVLFGRTRLFEQMAMESERSAALLRSNLFAVFAIFALSSPGHAWNVGGHAITLIVAGVVFGVLAALLVAILTTIEALGIRFFGSREGFRIDRLASLAICAHGSFGWIISAIGLHATIATFITLRKGIDGGDISHAQSFALLLTLVLSLLGTLAGFLFFEFFAWLGMRRCKFANRTRPPEPGAPRPDAEPPR